MLMCRIDLYGHAALYAGGDYAGSDDSASSSASASEPGTPTLQYVTNRLCAVLLSAALLQHTCSRRLCWQRLLIICLCLGARHAHLNSTSQCALCCPAALYAGGDYSDYSASSSASASKPGTPHSHSSNSEWPERPPERKTGTIPKATRGIVDALSPAMIGKIVKTMGPSVTKRILNVLGELIARSRR